MDPVPVITLETKQKNLNLLILISCQRMMKKSGNTQFECFMSSQEGRKKRERKDDEMCQLSTSVQV